MANNRYLTVSEAAAYTGLTETELIRSFYRGTAPGNLARNAGGQLVWDRLRLTPAKNRPAGAVFACHCGNTYKTAKGFAGHREKTGH